jgi:alpha-L-rhamnosidase
MTISSMRTNHFINPLGRDLGGKPYVSWVTEGTMAKRQEAAEIIVIAGGDHPETGKKVFDTGKIEKISSLGFELPITLEPYTRYFWKVTVWTDSGEEAESEWAFFETGKLYQSWDAVWIRADLPNDTHPYLRREFELPADAVWARAYVCGLGLYEFEINGCKVGDEYLMPGYHSYDLFVEYQTYDITRYLQKGGNCAAMILGPGWYKGRFIFGGGFKDIYGDTMELIAEIRIRLIDGTEWIIGSDSDWHGHTSPVKASGIYDGEEYNANEEIPGWSSPFLTCSLSEGWLPVISTGRTTADLVERVNPPLTIHERLRPKELIHTEAGEIILDFGQEITGWVEFNTRTTVPGTRIKLSYSEIIQDGKFYRDNLRTAKAVHLFVTGRKSMIARPHFTFFGFRFVKVEGIEDIHTEDFTACAIYSDIERTGWIETSDLRLNRLIENTIWSQKDNFLDIPTDCPQRDERMGWTGDAAVFCETANQHLYTPAFFNHYLKILRAEQKERNGAVPLFAPVPKPQGKAEHVPFWGKIPSTSVWGDAAALVPWSLWLMYGDRNILHKHYPLIRDWADWIIREDEADNNHGLWKTGFHLGDWLAQDTGDPQNQMGATDTNYIASVFYWNTVTIAAKVAILLGIETDYARFEAQAKKIRAAFLRTFFNKDGELTISETQTALALALYFDLFPEGAGKKLVASLVKRIEANGNHLDSGFVGTPFLCLALSKYGANETAYSLLLQDTFPSWLYEIDLGATTIWERWNSVLPNGKISGTDMNSLNHYAYGSIANWMYCYMAGLTPMEEVPGYKKVIIAPKTDPRIKSVHMIRETAAGHYEIEWCYEENGILGFHIVIPFDCDALIVLPEMQSFWVGAGEYTYKGYNGNFQC